MLAVPRFAEPAYPAAISTTELRLTVSREKASPVSNYMRLWSCRHCGRSNTTEIEETGTAQCAHCSRRTSIQPSRSRGGESVRLQSEFARPKTPRAETMPR